jgi:hypothetical protein
MPRGETGSQRAHSMACNACSAPTTLELLRTPNPAAVRPGNEVVQSDRLPYANV